MPAEEKMSLKQLFQGFKEWLLFINNQRKKIGYGTLIVLALILSYNYLKSPVYDANTTFVLERDNMGGMGGLSSLASLSGFNTSSLMGGASSLFQIDNIQELYKSNSMLKEALLAKVDINNKPQLLIAYFAKAEKLEKKWAKKQVFLKDFYKNETEFSRAQDSLIKDAIKLIKKSYLIVEKPNRNTSILNVGFSHKDELLAKLFNEVLVNKVNTFYYKTETLKTATNLKILQVQADSVKNVLNMSLLSLAELDQNIPNRNPLAKTALVPYEKAMVDMQANKAIYLEIVKQLELAKVAHRNKTPLIQIIDKPSFPLENSRWQFLNTLIIGLFGGAMFMVLSLSMQRIVLQALNE